MKQRAVGARIREMREERGWSLEDLASRIGMTKQGLAKLETGQSVPPLTTLCSIADALEAPVSTFFEEPPVGQVERLRRRAEQLLRTMSEQDLAAAVAVLETLAKHLRR